MYALLIEFETDAEREDALVRASRLYRRLTRGEPGNLRVEFLRRADRAHTFYLYELYRDAKAFDAHSRAEHTRIWHDGCAALTSSGISVTRLSPEAVDLSPPPLPPSKRPFQESSLLSPNRDLARISEPPRAASASASASALLRLRVVLETLEFASAEAGFMQMTPDACFLIGAYVLRNGEIEALARAAYRRSVREGRPCTLRANDVLFDVVLSPQELPLRALLFVLAIEENGGRDVASVYRDLLEPEAFRIWSARDKVPNPLQVREWFRDESDASGRCGSEAVDVLYHDEPIADRLSSDSWVGAAAAQFIFVERGEFRAGRFHVVSEDRGNDWLVQLSAQVY